MINWTHEEMERLQQLAQAILADPGQREEFQKQNEQLVLLMTYYKCAIMEIETKFNVLNEEFSLQNDRNPIASIKSRVKSPESIINKLRRLNKPITAASIEENLSDVAGIRVTCSFIDDVYALAQALLEQDDVFLVEKKDYITNPKPNGYRSLHLIVKTPIFLFKEKKIITVEIQLRTLAMDFWASLEHQLRYKKDLEFTPEMSQKLSECARISSLLDGEMNDLNRQVLGEID